MSAHRLLSCALALVFVLLPAAHARPQGGERPVRVGGDITEPRKLKNVNPIYPAEAKKAGIQDAVFVDCVIDTTGRVSQVTILRGNPILAEAVETAIRQWEYSPTLLNGEPVPVVMTVAVNYHLAGRSPTAAMLRALQEDPHPQVRRMAIDRLGDRCPTEEEICVALRNALGDPDEGVQRAARLALKREHR